AFWDLHSFPTRRSSDLWHRLGRLCAFGSPDRLGRGRPVSRRSAAAIIAAVVVTMEPSAQPSEQSAALAVIAVGSGAAFLVHRRRSEEHTSELQSRGHLV